MIAPLPPPTLLAAGATHTGAVRTSNEDAHVVDADAGVAIVCDGMGGHLAGEVASDLASRSVLARWTGPEVAAARAAWARAPSPPTRRAVVAAVRAAVLAANEEIIAQSVRDRDHRGMGTTFTGALVLPGEAVIAHAGDSRAYLIRDGAAIRLTEDHTLLARLADAGVDLSASVDATRWKGVVTNALGIGEPTRVAVSVVPLADGDRLVLCTDGVTEHVDDAELGALATSLASPARAAHRIVELAVERGGHDNATAVVVKVVEAGGDGGDPERRRADDAALAACPLLAGLSPARRLRALRIATEHRFEPGEPVPPRLLGEPSAWILVAGRAVRAAERAREGALLYPEMLVSDAPAPAGAEWQAERACRALVVRAGDLAELAREEPDLGELLYGALAARRAGAS